MGYSLRRCGPGPRRTRGRSQVDEKAFPHLEFGQKGAPTVVPVDRVPGIGGLLQPWSFGPRGRAPFRCGWKLEYRVALVQQGIGRGTLGKLATGRKGWHVSGRQTAGGVFGCGAGSGAETLVPVEGRFAVAVPELTPLPVAGEAGAIGKEDTKKGLPFQLTCPWVRTGSSSGAVCPLRGGRGESSGEHQQPEWLICKPALTLGG